jgi:hypothetical protein
MASHDGRKIINRRRAKGRTTFSRFILLITESFLANDQSRRSAVTLTQKDIKALFLQAKRVLRQPGLDVLLAPKRFPLGHLLVVTPRKVGMPQNATRFAAV